MDNDVCRRINNLINAVISNNKDDIKLQLGLSEDFDTDDIDNHKELCAAFDSVICGEDGIQHFFKRLEEAMLHGSGENYLLRILTYTSQFDKMKEYFDNLAEGDYLVNYESVAELLGGLARSPKYRPFVEKLLLNRREFARYVHYQTEYFFVNIASKTEDVDFIDSFIKENIHKRDCLKNNEGPSCYADEYYEIMSMYYAQLIKSTHNEEYIRKCYRDEELCKRLEFDYRDMVMLATASRDSEIIEECVFHPKGYFLPQNELIKLIKASRKKEFVIDALKYPFRYGLEVDYVPMLARMARIPANELESISFFNSKAGKVALELYSGGSETFEANYKVHNRVISLPEEMSIGIEIESTGFFSFLIRGTKGLKGWRSKEEESIKNINGKKIGVETVSPVLRGDNVEKTKNIVAINETLKAAGQYRNDTCGGHIHIGADYLKSEQAFQNLIELWTNNEKIFYLISNQAGELPREGIFKHASPISKEFEEDFSGVIQLNDEEDLRQFKRRLAKKQEDRHRSINFKNLRFADINTIEFRTPNCSLDPDVWIENINLFGGLVKVSQDLAEIQAKKPAERTQEEKEKLAIFDRLGTDTKLTEAERAELLINLIIEDEKSRPIYKERYHVNRRLLMQNPSLNEKLEGELSHKLIRYSDRNEIARAVFTGEDSVTGEDIDSVGEYIDDDMSLQSDSQKELPGDIE